MAKFEKAFNWLLGIEGKYSNHRFDPGGKTKYGITEKVAREFGYNGDMKDLDLEFAKKVYYEKYWKPYNFESIKNNLIAYELFEFTVNTGRGNTAIKNLQRTYNLFNKENLLVEDGILGPKTIKAINEYKFYKTLYKTLNLFQAMFYISLAEKDNDLFNNVINHKTHEGSKIYKTFIRGWMEKRVYDDMKKIEEGKK